MSTDFDWEIPLLAIPFAIFMAIMAGFLIAYLYYPKADLTDLIYMLYLSVVLMAVCFGVQRFHEAFKYRAKRAAKMEEEERQDTRTKSKAWTKLEEE